MSLFGVERGGTKRMFVAVSTGEVRWKAKKGGVF